MNDTATAQARPASHGPAAARTAAAGAAAAGRPTAASALPRSEFPPAASPSPQGHRSSLLNAFDHLASRVTRWAGSPTAFCGALAMILVWGLLGPVFGFSESWQLVVNTGTTIVTFLMVFLIQQSQNKDSTALHLKLDELLASSCDASNRLIGIEALAEQDLRELSAFYARLAERAEAGREDRARHGAAPDAPQAGAAGQALGLGTPPPGQPHGR